MWFAYVPDKWKIWSLKLIWEEPLRAYLFYSKLLPTFSIWQFQAPVPYFVRTLQISSNVNRKCFLCTKLPFLQINMPADEDLMLDFSICGFAQMAKYRWDDLSNKRRPPDIALWESLLSKSAFESKLTQWKRKRRSAGASRTESRARFPITQQRVGRTLQCVAWERRFSLPLYPANMYPRRTSLYMCAGIYKLCRRERAEANPLTKKAFLIILPSVLTRYTHTKESAPLLPLAQFLRSLAIVSFRLAHNALLRPWKHGKNSCAFPYRRLSCASTSCNVIRCRSSKLKLFRGNSL